MTPITVALKKFSVTADRRAADRFPIALDLRCKVLNKRVRQEFSGKTIDVSSSGILFTTAQELLPGRLVELSIEWPAKLNERCSLKLIAKGKVVRIAQGRAAMDIRHYEFRTTTARAISSPQAAHGLMLPL
jgi:PilZ domain